MAKKACFNNKIVEGEPSPREIIWIFDATGWFPIQGKSTWVKYNVFKNNACNLGAWSAPKDLFEVRAAFKTQRLVLMNITRSVPQNADVAGVYSAIEAIKDGLFNKDKYLSTQITTQIPHVIIFANSLPNPGFLSIDRWKVYSIHKRELKLLNTNTLDSIIKANWNLFERLNPMPEEALAKDTWNRQKHAQYKTLWSTDRAPTQDQTMDDQFLEELNNILDD